MPPLKIPAHSCFCYFNALLPDLYSLYVYAAWAADSRLIVWSYVMGDFQVGGKIHHTAESSCRRCLSQAGVARVEMWARSAGNADRG
jgi:hypothetical protein